MSFRAPKLVSLFQGFSVSTLTVKVETKLRAMVGNVNRFMIKLVKDPVVLRSLVRKIGQKKLGRELREM